MAAITSIYISKIYLEEVQNRVRVDLSSARQIYKSYIDRTSNIVKAISFRRTIALPLEEQIQGDLGTVFRNIYYNTQLDILTLVDMSGKVIYRAHNPNTKGDNIIELPIISKVIQEWAPVSGTFVISEHILEEDGPELLNRAVVKVFSTPNSRTNEKIVERNGMVIASAIPLTSLPDNKRLGIILGGYLINNKNEIVDDIKSRVFQDQNYKENDIGTATIFLDDVRISTNVKFKDTIRATGSRLSAEVYDKVIRKGEIWADRAFVVDDQYITAYEPIRDIDNKIIGALYIGLLEEPYRHPQRIIIGFFIVAIIITSVASLLLIYFYTKAMIKPIESIINMSKKIMKGDWTARCNLESSGEMGFLCTTINQMAEAIEQQKKIAERETQMQIGQSEKLASVGRLAAGIAHEINNPLTGVLTYSHLLKEKAKNKQDLDDIEIVIKETTRVRDIVRGLLDFARQSPSSKELIQINKLIRQLLKLIISQREFRGIKIVENYEQNLPEFMGDKNQLQQVFLNILLNAAEAIHDSGTITITTFEKKGSIQIAISDTGCGIESQDIDKIFDPFYTTKPVGKGTGLGLSVSYGIIQQHGGNISCKSNLGTGTTFTISLPLKIQ